MAIECLLSAQSLIYLKETMSRPNRQSRRRGTTLGASSTVMIQPLDKLMEMGAVTEAIIRQGLRAQIGKKFVRSRRQVESLFDDPAV